MIDANFKNYEAFMRVATLENTDWLYNTELSLAENVLDLLHQTVILPNPKLSYKLVTAYLLLPSALCTSFPYLLCFGKAGCGKSTIGYIAGGLHNVEVLQGNTTFAALRNTTNTRLFWDIENKNTRRNSCLIWDDISPGFIRDERLYSFFKSGYKKASDVCRLAGKETGEVIEFHTFIPKIVSTIHNFFAKHEFSEIERRLLVIPHKRYSEFSDTEKLELASYNPDIHPDNLIDVSLINWDELHHHYVDHWLDDDNIVQFVNTASGLKKKNKGFKVPSRIGRKNWDVLPDLLASGIHYGLWTRDEGLNLFCEYYELREELNKDPSGISAYLKEHLEPVESKFRGTGIAIELDPKSIKDDLFKVYNAGILQIRPTNELIAEAMGSLGYEMRRDNRRSFKWIK